MVQELLTETLEQFPLRPYKPMHLCAMYGIDRKTFLKWISVFRQEIGERRGHFYTAAQVEIIIEKLGVPGKMIVDKE